MFFFKKLKKIIKKDVMFMCGKTFILTDKIEFFPDKDLERELNFNFRASGYVFNKTLEASIYRENLVNEFGIGTECKVNRTYTQK